MSAEDETIRTRKWLSAEILIAVCIPLFAGVFAYGQLHGKVNNNAKDLSELSREEKETRADVAEIKTDVAVIKQSVKATEQNVERWQRQAEENNRLIQEVLRRLPE